MLAGALEPEGGGDDTAGVKGEPLAGGLESTRLRPDNQLMSPPLFSPSFPFVSSENLHRRFQYQHTRWASNHLNALMYLQVAHVPLLPPFVLVIHRICKCKLRRSR